MASCSHLGFKKYPMDKVDKALIVGMNVAKAADAWTTIEGLNHDGVYETNIILGKHPSDGEVVGYMILTSLLSHYLAQYMTPDVRKVFLSITSVVHGYAAWHNWNLVND